MKEIVNWLNSEEKDWTKGLALFTQHSKNKSLIRIISIKLDQTRYRNKLVHELTRISKTAKEQPKKDVKPTKRKRVVKNPKPVAPGW